MQVKFDSDPAEGQPVTRKKKRFRITVTASIIVEDDTFVDTQWISMSDEEVPESLEDQDNQGIEWFEGDNAYARPRNLDDDPVDAANVMEALTDLYDSTLEFVQEDEDIQGALQTFIVEVDDNGRPVGQTRNQSEAQ